MILFTVRAYDGFVEGTASVYTSSEFCELLGSAERLSVSAIVSGSTGTGHTLTCQFENSPDGTRWINQSSTPELNGAVLDGGHQAFEFVNDDNALVQGYVRLRLALGGTSPTAVVRLWVVGRSPSGPYIG